VRAVNSSLELWNRERWCEASAAILIWLEVEDFDADVDSGQALHNEKHKEIQKNTI
jgi:hypothetical protein